MNQSTTVINVVNNYSKQFPISNCLSQLHKRTAYFKTFTTIYELSEQKAAFEGKQFWSELNLFEVTNYNPQLRSWDQKHTEGNTFPWPFDSQRLQRSSQQNNASHLCDHDIYYYDI